MTNPIFSAGTSNFRLSGVNSVDALLTELYASPSAGKWGGPLGTGASLSYSFPWASGSEPVWQVGYDSAPLTYAHAAFNSTEQAAVRYALQQWANVADLSFTEVADGVSDVGDIRLAFTASIASSVWGYSSNPSSYWAAAGDVWVNKTFADDQNWSAGSYNLNALMHETGHSLGLKHPGDYNGDSGGVGIFLPASLDNRVQTIMSYYDYRQLYWDKNTRQNLAVYPETPMVLDIQAIQYLYGANNTFNSGDTTYRLTTDIPFYKTLWDGGGVDCLDLSDFSLNCKISLIPGSYSSLMFRSSTTDTRIYTGENDLGIAYGCYIENVVGGSGSDVITGNNLNNCITGNGGNDTIDAGDGVDTVVFSGNRARYTIRYDDNTSSFSVIDTGGVDSTDTLKNIEFFQFSDVLINALALADSVAPTLASCSPANAESTVFEPPVITLTFSEVIVKGAGNIEIHSVSPNGPLLETFNIQTSSALTIKDNQLIIRPSQLLLGGVEYSVVLTAGVVKDQADNAYAGTTGYGFMVLNHAPAATDSLLSVAEDSVYTFGAADFGFSDNSDHHVLAAVRISRLPSLGSLLFNGVAITSEQVSNGFEVSAADLLLGKLSFQPQVNANGDDYSSFSFQVRDTGGTERGGVDLEPQPNTITFNVWPVNDSPTGKLEISGDPVAGKVLQINSTVQDADGFAKIQYQWLSDGDVITDATDDHFTLRAQDVGHVLSVVGRYTDFGGTPESVFSANKMLVLPEATITSIAVKTVVSGTRNADVFDCALYAGLKIMGGEGDDSYLISSSACKLIESAHSGVDSVYSSVSFTLPSNIENLFSDASSSVVLTGNSGQNLIRGGSGNDSLNGLSGNDTLVGGDGQDVFMFTTTLNSRTNLDTILDFNPQEDVIGLKAALFRKLGANVDAFESDFLSNGIAKTSHSYLLYDPDTGYLSYDADANGPSLARPIAIIGQHLTLTPANFII